ncbi:MAG TPA: hypothetical protein VFU40_09570 [Gemmatimonadales bacterium]|nr:hypothetical protein [Gemmatimonadales bacterium]
MTKHLWFGTGLLLAACGGGGGAQSAQPASSAAGAVRNFMQAVADSNLDKMAMLWGNANGPASKTGQPPDWERRIAIMQAYLRNDSFRIISDVPEAGENRRAQQVEIKRKTCTWTVPFVTIKARDGSWLVTQIDLAAAGNPARPCVEGDSISGT